MNLLRAELLKIRTTNTWWLLGLGALITLILAFLLNMVTASFEAPPPEATEGLTPEQAAQVAAQSDSVFQAANLYTSGQFFGLLFVLLLGILVVTNEFHHQTATTTFLTVPHRSAVVAAKLVAAALLAAALWLVTKLLAIPATLIFLGSKGLDNHLGEWAITRSLLLNLLAYVLWAILGVGFGVLIRSQIGATVTAAVLYLVGTSAASLLFIALQAWTKQEWIGDLQVIVPSIASDLMVTGRDLPGNPPQWVGAAVLVGYALVTGTIGTLIMRRRDIS